MRKVLISVVFILGLYFTSYGGITITEIKEEPKKKSNYADVMKQKLFTGWIRNSRKNSIKDVIIKLKL